MYHQEHLLHLIILLLRTCTVVDYFIIIFNACLLCSYSTMCLATHGFSLAENVLTSGSCCLTFPHGFLDGLTVLLTESINSWQWTGALFYQSNFSLGYSTDNTELISTVYCILDRDPCLNLTEQHHHYFSSQVSCIRQHYLIRTFSKHFEEKFS